MADLNRKMAEGHTVSDLDTVIDEVYGARGEYDTLGERLDEIDTVIDTAKLGIHYKGEVDYYSNLPTTGVSIGDAYTVKYSGSSGTTPDGTEYVWGTVSGTNQWINFSKDSYTKAEVDALLALKQNALNTAQLAAVNSGIDSTKVGQIETNKNNILSAYGGIVGKNLFDINNATEAGKNRITAIIENDAITVTNTGNYSYVSYPLSLKAGTYRISATISDYEADEPSSCFIVVAQTSNASGTYLARIPITGNGDVSDLFTINENKTVYITYCPMLSSGSGTNTFNIANNMIMKNGDDTTYQPYIYSNAELTAAIQALQAQLANQ